MSFSSDLNIPDITSHILPYDIPKLSYMHRFRSSLQPMSFIQFSHRSVQFMPQIYVLGSKFNLCSFLESVTCWSCLIYASFILLSQTIQRRLISYEIGSGSWQPGYRTKRGKRYKIRQIQTEQNRYNLRFRFIIHVTIRINVYSGE